MADPSQQPQEWNPVDALKRKYPNAGLSDPQIFSHLRDPNKFREAFPEFDVSDDEIRSNMGRFALKHPEYGSLPSAVKPPNPILQELEDRKNGATAGLPGSSPNPQPANDGMMTAAELGIGAAGAYVGGPPLVQLMRAHPIVSSLALGEAQQIPGIVGRVAGKVPSWLPLLAGKSDGGAPAEEGAATQPPLLSGEQQPSGRFVLSPDEAQAQDQQMRLAQQMARQRGMQYAAGQKPDQ